MSNSADVAQLYKNVIEEVIKNVRTDFVNMGVDEQVLVDLQASWEQKLIEARVFKTADFPITTTRDYGHSGGFFYPPPGAPSAMEGKMSYGGSVATMPLAPGYAPRAFPIPYYAPVRPGVQLQPAPSALLPLLPMNLDRVDRQNAPAEKGTPSGAGSVPQYDGADHDNDSTPSTTARAADTERRTIDKVVFDFVIPQTDGADDSPGAGARIKADPESLSASRTPPVVPNDELGSDLDDEDEDEAAVDDENIEDLILCQYEKISRVRTRWRGVLRAGIIHINRADYCFSRANNDFDW